MNNIAPIDIKEYYLLQCKSYNKTLNREEYRKTNPKYSSSLIEKIWGSWTNFVKEIIPNVFSRNTIKSSFNKETDKIVISFVQDGSSINEDVFLTLKTYCKHNHAKLGILWGKGNTKNTKFNKETYDKLKDYLATEFTFNKDESCLAKDFLIPVTQKNPLLNLDKLSTTIKTIIVGAAKQYIKILPYNPNETYRISCSTGTISMPDYKETVSAQLDYKFHTFGGILLNWNNKLNRYEVRNLIYKNGCIQDINKKYTKDHVEIINDSVSAMVLGDLHFPEENINAVNNTKNLIKLLNPAKVFIHDWCSFNSINHHDEHKALTKLINNHTSLQDELKLSFDKLKALSKTNTKSKFIIIQSNHDNFIIKWLNEGNFVWDKENAKLGAQYFIRLLENNSLFDDFDNVSFKNNIENCIVNDIFCGMHGHDGISGAKGSLNSFSKTYTASITGHTHSPCIYENQIVVGTLSKLQLAYNKDKLTAWANCNAIVYKNGSVQLFFV